MKMLEGGLNSGDFGEWLGGEILKRVVGWWNLEGGGWVVEL